MRVAFVSSLAAVLFGFAGPTQDPAEGKCRTFSWALGKTYESSFTEKEFLSAPVWRTEDESPPLPARKAIRLAARMKDSLVTDSNTVKWQLMRVQLQPIGNERWFWLVEFEPVVQGKGQNGDALALVVLMDGNVVKPRVD